MRMLWILAAVAVFVYSLYAWFTVDRRPDGLQIAVIVSSAETAVNSRDLSVLVPLISVDFDTPSGVNRDRLRLIAVRTFRNDSDFRVHSVLKGLLINGDTAKAVIGVTIDNWEELHSTTERDISVTFAKENTTHMGVIPCKVWRATWTDSLVVGDY